MLNKVSWFMFTISVSIAVLVAIITSFFEAFLLVVLRSYFSVSGDGRSERVCILFAMYSILPLMFAFLIWRCARCFHGTFAQITFCHFSGEALSFTLASAYFAMTSLLVPTRSVRKKS